jgi:cytochrome c oxidase cbb3-type subunit 2
MPGYRFLAETELDYGAIAAHMQANRAVGVPYSEAQIASAVADVRAQANPDDTGVSDLLKRYPKATVRDFDGNPKSVSEMDALVAYLQMLGTLVDFKLYDAKANLR